MNLELLILLFVFLGNKLTIADKPNMNDLEDTICPKEKPFLCVPYGSCCSDIEYCHAGKCEPCFAKNISECDLLTYCKDESLHDESKMKKGVCAKACEVRLAASKLSECDEGDNWKTIFIIVMPALVAGVTICIIIFLIMRCKKRKQRRMPPKNNPENISTEEPLMASDIPVQPDLARALSQEEENNRDDENNRDEEENDDQPPDGNGIELREFDG
ncbi:hypothetical protein Bpfe_013771 [Biomphalaria pfeifferi]|uniref:Uncharacterized protein n=1 Tax=Biomphalaria pfeifferi TaxID=112525 RepID=A0AAD8BLJ8_BIOPF|nr:hypothetical protein Bpfe_013771 [Biomphalaria pfeifferi]